MRYVSFYSFAFSFVWGTVLFCITAALRKYLISHRAYKTLQLLSCATIFRFVFIFEIPYGNSVSWAINDSLAPLEESLSVDQINQFLRLTNAAWIIPVVWFLVAAILVLRVLWSYISFAHQYRKVPVDTSPDIYNILKTARHELGVSEQVMIKRDPTEQIPRVFGFFRHTIILPYDPCCDACLEGIIRHELAHIRNHDEWKKAVFLVVDSLFWWNPMIKKAGVFIGDTMECVCDLVATENLTHESKCDYVICLNNMHGNKKRIPSLVTSLTMPFDEKDSTANRIRAILFPSVAQKRVLTYLALGYLCVLIVSAFFMFAIVQKADVPTYDKNIEPGLSVYENKDGTFELWSGGLRMMEFESFSDIPDELKTLIPKDE